MLAGKGRFAFSVAGVAVATLLLAFVLGVYRGWNDGLGTYMDNTGADVWVTPRGADGFFTPAIMSRGFVSLVEEQPNIREVHTILYRPAKLRFEGGKFDTWVVGFTEGGLGGPVGMKRGSARPGSGEIVLDDVEARLAGIKVGDTVDLAGRPLKVVGISTGGNVVFAQIAFVSDKEARAEFQQAVDDAHLSTIPPGLDPATNVNLVLLKVERGRAAETAAAINKNVPGVNAFVTAEFSENSRRALKQAILPILAIILGLAFLVGTLVLGLTVYTSVLEKEREFGVIKAVGTPATGLLRIVLEQALTSCVFGYAVGVAATFAAAAIVSFAVPQFIVSIYLADLAIIFLGAVAMSGLASLLPAARVLRADTMTVFKA